MTAEMLPVDYTITLTDTHSKDSVKRMRYGDIQKRLTQSQKTAFRQLAAIHDEQNKLRPQYRRYLDLEAQAKFYESRIKRTAAALQDEDEFESLDESAKKGRDISRIVGVAVNYADVPLWEIMLAVLEETGELQVIELETALTHLGFKTSRSAIESSLKTHRNEFQIRASGRNKFVSLKR
jgi:hypothetical protein